MNDFAVGMKVSASTSESPCGGVISRSWNTHSRPLSTCDQVIDGDDAAEWGDSLCFSLPYPLVTVTSQVRTTFRAKALVHRASRKRLLCFDYQRWNRWQSDRDACVKALVQTYAAADQSAQYRWL